MMSTATLLASGALNWNAALWSGRTRGYWAPITFVACGLGVLDRGGARAFGRAAPGEVGVERLEPFHGRHRPVCGVPAKYINCGLPSLNAGHSGRPLPFGSPHLAKLVQ